LVRLVLKVLDADRRDYGKAIARLATQYIQLYIIQVTIGFLLYTLLFTLVSGLLGAIGEIELTLLDSLSRRIQS